MFISTLHTYMDSATVHGVGRVKNSQHFILKVIWVLALVGALIMIGIQVYTLYKKYESKPIGTTVTLKNPDYLAFPGVLLCNTNPVQFSNVAASSQHDFLYDVLDIAAARYGIPLAQYQSDQVSYLEAAGSPPNPNAKLEKILLATGNRFKTILTVVDNESLMNLSQPMSEFIITCSFAGRDCTEDSFSYYRTLEYGLCVKFTPDVMMEKSPPLVAAAGSQYGLDLLLDVDQSEGLPFVTPSAGVYVSVFDSQPDSPIIKGLNKGTIVPTGFESSIAVSMYEEKRVGEEDGRCNPADQTIPDCIHECQQVDMEKVCGCYEYFFELEEVVDNTSMDLDLLIHPLTGFSPCNTFQEMECISLRRSQYLVSQPAGCRHCKVPCNRREYELDVSMVRWPADNFVPVLATILTNKDSNKFSEQTVRDNYVSLKVYLASMTYQRMEEEYIYTGVNFISDIGGQLGLWAGVSVLSMLEVLELGTVLLSGLVYAYWKPKQGQIADRPDKEPVPELPKVDIS